jgi:hypothetical protein
MISINFLVRRHCDSDSLVGLRDECRAGVPLVWGSKRSRAIAAAKYARYCIQLEPSPVNYGKHNDIMLLQHTGPIEL